MGQGNPKRGKGTRISEGEQDQLPSAVLTPSGLTATALVPCRYFGSLPAVQHPLLPGGP